MNPAYKHLSDRLRIAELTIPQIAALCCGLLAGLVFALYLSPFSAYLTLFISIYLASVPVGAVLLASTTEFDIWLYLRARAAHHLTCGRYAAGPGAGLQGYVIEEDSWRGRGSTGDHPFTLEPEALWDS